MTDVLVVGGGPAGSATALRLARRGHRVQLIDRATFPRRKPCGEGLFPGGVAVLDELGVLDDLRDQSAILETLRFSFDSVIAEGRLGTHERPALGVQRDLLDNVLLEAAGAAGVEVCTGVRALGLSRVGERFAVETERGRIEARVIVAADGLRSGLRRAAGLDQQQQALRYGVTAHVELAATPPRVEVTFHPGYEVYLTPVGNRLANVALLLDRERAASFAGDLAGRFEALAAPALASGYRLVEPPRAAGPFPASARRVWRDNFVLTGDAAGFYDGISGDGMSLALVSSLSCAEAIDAHLRTGSTAPFDRYERERRRLARASTLLARLSLMLANRPSLGRRAVANLARRPQTFDRLIAVNSGELPLTALRPRDLIGLLLGV